MVRCNVGIGYFPFFFAAAFFAAVFFAAVALVAFFAAGFAAFLATFFAAALAGAFFAAAFFTAGAGIAGVFVVRRGRSTRASASGSIEFPSAPDSISTTSDHRMWYVETSLYGMTC